MRLGQDLLSLWWLNNDRRLIGVHYGAKMAGVLSIIRVTMPHLLGKGLLYRSLRTDAQHSPIQQGYHHLAGAIHGEGIDHGLARQGNIPQ